MNKKQIQARLEYLRQELRAERIGIGELAELYTLKAFIGENDVELLEASGVPEMLYRLDKMELIDLLMCYDDYIKDFDYENSGVPVCLNEFYDNEYQVILKGHQ